jgi:hypothetical protein
MDFSQIKEYEIMISSHLGSLQSEV